MKTNIYTTFNEQGLLTVSQVLLTLNRLNMLQVNNPNDKPLTINKYHLHITLIKQLFQKPRTPKNKLLTPSALAQQLIVFTVHHSNCGSLRLVIVLTFVARCRTHTDDQSSTCKHGNATEPRWVHRRHKNISVKHNLYFDLNHQLHISGFNKPSTGSMKI